MLFRVLLVAALLSPAALAQTNTFDVVSGGKTIGKDTYTLAKAKQGYKLNSRASTHFGGSESNVDSEYKYDDHYGFTVGSSSNIVTQLHTSYTPSKARTSLVVAMTQAGVQNSRDLGIKPDFTLLPAYDAGAAQVMLLLAATHPTATNLYNIVVPGLDRSGPPEMADAQKNVPSNRAASGDFAYDALWTKGADATGTLDGKPVALHSYVLTAGKSTWTFYADDANTLMQVNVSSLNTNYIRAKFKLDGGQ